ncbi:hypothetical protein WJX84_008361 [Apatococcus fuscideae]|uniref:Band 7 domain-containing protein n=1 Tax=Apatococcus fuscideae TaxID=2026836 RepID=A0AAW1S6M9_9CHLO
MGNICCTACIDTANVGVVERCGKFDRLAEPGCHIICCPLGEAVRGTVSLRVQQLDVHCETKTKDNVFCNISVNVQFEVIREKVEDAYYRLTDPARQINAYVYDVVRSTVPNMVLDDVFSAKEDIARNVKAELAKAMDKYGFSIIIALVTDIRPAANVMNAMNEINASSRLREAAIQKAEANKLTSIKHAEADAESKYLQGQGIARQRLAIINGLKESVINFEQDIPGISSKDVVELMMLTQWIDMMRDIGQTGRQTVFMPHSPAGMADVTAQMRAGILQGGAATLQ